MTLSDESIAFDFNGDAPIERSYAVVERQDQRYTLAISDDRSAKTVVVLELASCGLFVESEAVCDAFCKNLAAEIGVPTDEQIRARVEQLFGGQDEELLERAIEGFRESIEQGPRPVFPERAFFVGEVKQ